MNELPTLTPPLIAGLVVLLAIQFGLLAWALVDWVRRPAELVRGNMIVWLIVLALFNTIGPILYLTIGRETAAVNEPTAPAVGDASAAVDSLYGANDTSGS